jgi:transcriptional regulator with XRE-family HTH domain
MPELLARMPLDDLDTFIPLEEHPMTVDAELVVTRGQLAGQLKAHRTAAQISQIQVATSLGWSPVKIARIENAKTKPSVTDVRALLTTYGVTDKDEVENAVVIATVNRRHPRNTTYNDAITADYRNYLGFEAAATEICLYSSELVPDILRTEAYAQSVTRVLGEPALNQSEANAALRAQLRRERAAYLLGPDGPAMHIILDEMVFYRPVGNEEQSPDHAYDEVTTVIRGLQRLNLAGWSKTAGIHLNPRVAVQIAPPTLGPLCTNRGPLSVLSTNEQSAAAAHTEWSDGEISWFGGSDRPRGYQHDFAVLSSKTPPPEKTNAILDSILARLPI